MGNTILFNTAGSIALAVNYELQGPYTGKYLSKEAAKSIRINAEFFVRVDDAVICVDTDTDLGVADLDTGADFDASDTYYIYACHPLSGIDPVFKISKNSTYPAGGWSADTSRKIGGFDTDGSGNVDEATLWDLRTVDISGAASSSHAATHKRGGTDEVDGDQLDIDWDPANYTPDTSISEASSADHLAAHLAGIDNAIRATVYGVAWDESADTYVRTGVLASEACGASPGDTNLPIQRNMRRCVVSDGGVVQYYLDPDDSYNKRDEDPSVTGTDDAGTANKLSDAGVFTAAESEYKGKYIHNTTDDTYALITAKDSDNVLSISADIMDIGETFEICTAVLDGDDGQVMVEIPKFFFRYDKTGNVHTWEISNVQLPGFKVHPAFVKNGVEVDYRYVGAYEGSMYDDSAGAMTPSGSIHTSLYASGDKLCSVAGQYPKTYETRAEFRAMAEERGTGWHQLDFYLVSAIELLYLVEYADFDSQTMIGNGRTTLSGGAWTAGSYIGITGLSNGDGNGTGAVQGGALGDTDYMSYRGIENLFGNIWKFVDGINVHNSSANGSRAYVCPDYDDFADDTDTDYDLVTSDLAQTDGYVDELCPVEHGFLPKSVGGSSSTYICDYYYTYYNDDNDSGWRVCLFGGGAYSGVLAGAFYWNSNSASSYARANVGGRLCF